MTGISVLFAFYHGIFPSESDTDFDDGLDTGIPQFGVVFLFADLSEGTVCQRIQFRARVCRVLKRKEKAGDTTYLRCQLDVKASKAGFPIGTHLIAIPENRT